MTSHPICCTGGRITYLCIWACALFGSAGLRNTAGAIESMPLPTLETISSVFEKREADMGRAKFTWSTHRTEPKGSRKSPAQPKAINPRGETISPKETSFTIDASLSFDNGRVRYEFTHSNWNYGEDYVGPKTAIDVFDGTVGKDFRPPGAVFSFPTGHITHKWQSEDNAELYPLMWTAKPMSTIPTAGTAIKRTGDVGGETCVILESLGTRHTEYWLAPSKGFSVVRQAAYGMNGSLVAQYDVKYARGTGSEYWVPDSWTATIFHGASPRMFFNGKLKTFELDSALTLASVDFEFPVGTRVIDRTRQDGDPSRNGLVEYIVRDSQARRPIVLDEWKGVKRGDEPSRRQAYERIVDTEPPSDGTAGARWTAAIVSLIVVLVVVGIVWRIRTNRG
jgi:hypothetical protein